MNDFITKRGFNLYRGDIGSKVENQTKTEWQIKELNAELEELKQEKENVLRTIENSKYGLETANKPYDNDTLLNPTRRRLGGYKEEDVNKIIDYTKDLKKQVVILNTDNQNKDIEINKLLKENDTFRNNKELIKRNELIKEQKSTIKEQKQEINRLNGVVKILENSIEDWKEKVEEVKESFEKELKKWIDILRKVCKAIDKLLNRDKPKEYLEDYEDIADAINYGWYNPNKNKNKDDFEMDR